jgi:hypothetical protein
MLSSISLSYNYEKMPEEVFLYPQSTEIKFEISFIILSAKHKATC